MWVTLKSTSVAETGLRRGAQKSPWLLPLFSWMPREIQGCQWHKKEEQWQNNCRTHFSIHNSQAKAAQAQLHHCRGWSRACPSSPSVGSQREGSVMPFHELPLRNIKAVLQSSELDPHKMKGKIWWDFLAAFAVEQFIWIQNAQEKNYVNNGKCLKVTHTTNKYLALFWSHAGLMSDFSGISPSFHWYNKAWNSIHDIWKQVVGSVRAQTLSFCVPYCPGSSVMDADGII